MRHLVLISIAIAAGCASKPVTAPRVVVPETAAAEIRAAARQARSFGDMTPIAVGISNGSAEAYEIAADRVFAVDRDLQRIAPLSVTEAARQAGGATELAAGLRGAGAGALMTGVLGAVTGAIVGAGTGKAGKGAAIGAGVGAAAGAIGGYIESKGKTEQEVRTQLGDLYLGEQDLKPALPVSGFVFFPKGEYVGVRVLAVRQTDGHVEEYFGPMVAEP